MHKISDLNFSPKPPASGFMTMQSNAFRVGCEIFLPCLAGLLQYDVHPKVQNRKSNLFVES